MAREHASLPFTPCLEGDYVLWDFRVPFSLLLLFFSHLPSQSPHQNGAQNRTPHNRQTFYHAYLVADKDINGPTLQSTLLLSWSLSLSLSVSRSLSLSLFLARSLALSLSLFLARSLSLSLSLSVSHSLSRSLFLTLSLALCFSLSHSCSLSFSLSLSLSLSLSHTRAPHKYAKFFLRPVGSSCDRAASSGFPKEMESIGGGRVSTLHPLSFGRTIVWIQRLEGK